jgi:hypothetical protein
LVATGATWPRDLNIPGRQLNGIYFAMSFLQGNYKYVTKHAYIKRNFLLVLLSNIYLIIFKFFNSND